MRFYLPPRLLAVAFGALVGSAPALATPFTFIRIGDVDGFGFTPTTGLVRAGGGAADTNGNGLLQQTEFLPDLNANGSVATGSGDDFDNRGASELANTLVQGSGFTSSAGTSGSHWTDISLSTSFHTTFPGGSFPDPSGPGTPNEPLFSFRFDVAKSDIVVGSTLFFNLIFGDYDVLPADVDVTKNNGTGGLGTTSTIALTRQGGGQDGLIQAATLSLLFSDVFSDGGAVWNGVLDVKFDAPNEPYTAFDFAELSLDEIPFDPVPDSATTGGLVGGMLLVLVALARGRAATRS